MSILLPLLHFLAFLVYLSLLLYLLWKDSKTLLHRVCSAFLACLTIWSVGLTFYYAPGISKSTAAYLNNISSIGWIGFASLFLWFTLIFTEKKKILNNKIIHLLLFILPVILIYMHWTGYMVADYIQRPWGWSKILSKTIWNPLFYIYYLYFTITSLYLIYLYKRKTKEPIRRKQAEIIFLTSLASLIMGTINEVILPSLGIIRIPSMANIITLIWACGLVYAITKYSFMAITPVAAAEKIVSTMIDSLLLLDKEGRIVSVNEALLNLSGYQKRELIRKPVSIFFNDTDFKNSPMNNNFNKEPVKNHEINFKTKKGNDIPILFSSSTIAKEGAITGIVCIIKDISERKGMYEKIKELVRIDFLTGCYNRRYGLELIDRQIKLASREQSSLLLAFVDVDNLKKINDAFGHNEGDQVLKKVAGLFRSTLREVDIICRMGGDEFLLAAIDSSLNEVHLFRKRLNEKLTQLNHNIEKNYQIQFSIGFSEYSPNNPKTLEELIASADREMYKEKKTKKRYV